MPKGYSPITIPYPNTTDPELALPAADAPFPKELLLPELQSILVRLEQKYGAALHVKGTDSQWVEISVDNLSPSELHGQLQSERNVLFGPTESRVQVIPPLRPTGSEIYLHVLTEPDWSDRGVAALSGAK